ncbi:MAG: DUF3108 domain-containing protein [Candidatus Neomarinimicrobiota bacterium]
MSLPKIILLAGFLTSLGAETYHYTIYFWKIPCVHITMTISDTGEARRTELDFTTRTTKAFSYIFPVNSRYRTILDAQTFQMLRYEKNVEQPNLKQKLTILWNAQQKVYQSDSIHYERPEGTHNIFSLLLRARSTDWESLDMQWWPMDHEGRFLKSRFLWVDSTEIDLDGERHVTDHYRVDLIPGNSDAHLVDVTDVFTWGIGLEDCVRQIWIERGEERRILRAEVKVKGFTLFAELDNE